MGGTDDVARALGVVRRRRALRIAVALAALHLALAWPGAGRRGVIAEEIQPYLRAWPQLLDRVGGGLGFLPPNDDPALRAAVAAGRPIAPRWVATVGWPELGWQGARRVWPLLVRGHQTALGSWVGIGLGPLLGGGIAGVRHSSVLLGLALVLLTYALGRRLGLLAVWAALAAAATAASPGVWFFGRTGYGFELASRVLMLVALVVAAPRRRLGWGRALAVGGCLALAVLARATVAATLVPVLLLMLFDPRREASRPRVAAVLVVGAGLPVALALVLHATLPHLANAGIHLPLEALAGRTLVAPRVLVAQLAWVVDARVVLGPFLAGATEAPLGGGRAALGLLVVVPALVRWWHGRALEPERLFVAGVIANALAGAWLYGDPRQFQLGMALEPLFALAVAAQLATFGRPRLLAGGLLLARVGSVLALLAAEARTDNPMLSGAAQRGLVALLEADGVRGDDVVTTSYDHVGVLEAWSGERLRPVHGYRVLMADGVSDEELAARWAQLLDARRPCRVVLTRAPSLVTSPFESRTRVAAALDRALAASGRAPARRRTLTGDGGGPVFEVVDLACGGAP